MADQPGKEQMMKFLAPAAAAAVVIVLVGVLLAFRDNPDSTAPDKSKPLPGGGNARKQGPGLDAVAVDTDGLSQTLPPLDAPEWKTLADGLKIWDVKEGSGDVCDNLAMVKMHYTGWLTEGIVFDSSVTRADPLVSPLGKLIEGWQKGVPGMKPGGIRRLYIPWEMAYGAGGQPPKIPPKANLVFEIKLFGFT